MKIHIFFCAQIHFSPEKMMNQNWREGRVKAIEKVNVGEAGQILWKTRNSMFDFFILFKI